MAETASSPAPVVLAASGLACRRTGREIFKDLSFSLRPGDALILRGRNGSGKSTLLRLLAGLLPAAAGSLVLAPALDGRSLHYVGHADPLKTVLTVEENLRFVTTVLGGGDVEAGLAAFALARLADTPARHLSSGQRRRLTLARLAAVVRPLWLLDEPAVGLDAQNRARLERLVAGHRATGGAVIAATHGDVDLPDAAALELGS